MVDKNLVTDQMIAQFVDPKEPIMFQELVSKVSRWGFHQARILVVTTEHFYLFEDKKISRTHNLATIVAIIKSKVSNEIVLVFPSTDAKDLRLDNMRFQEELETIIKLRFCNRNMSDTLKIF
jgi:hypothetical protein